MVIFDSYVNVYQRVLAKLPSGKTVTENTLEKSSCYSWKNSRTFDWAMASIANCKHLPEGISFLQSTTSDHSECYSDNSSKKVEKLRWELEDSLCLSIWPVVSKLDALFHCFYKLARVRDRHTYRFWKVKHQIDTRGQWGGSSHLFKAQGRRWVAAICCNLCTVQPFSAARGFTAARKGGWYLHNEAE